MSIEIKGKVYRNLQEQVEKNKEDIDAINKNKTVTHCLKMSGSTSDPESQTVAVWTLTAYHKMPINDVKNWPDWIQGALNANEYSIDSMLYYVQGNLVPLYEFSYGKDKEVPNQINCRGVVIGTSGVDERHFNISISDYDLDTEFEI